MLWSTSMEIPAGAPNPAAAEAWMNYVYDPKVQADIAEYVNYVTPVKGVKAILRKRDPELAENQLIFPSTAVHEELLVRIRARRRTGQERLQSVQRSPRRLTRCGPSR